MKRNEHLIIVLLIAALTFGALYGFAGRQYLGRYDHGKRHYGYYRQCDGRQPAPPVGEAGYRNRRY